MQTNRCFQVKVIRAPLLVGLLTGLAAVLALAEAAEDGFVEVVGVGFNSLVELKDGSLLSNDLRVSTDGGKTWAAYPSTGGASGAGIMRLKSGSLAIVSPVGESGVAERISEKQVKVMRIYPLTWFYE